MAERALKGWGHLSPKSFDIGGNSVAVELRLTIFVPIERGPKKIKK